MKSTAFTWGALLVLSVASQGQSQASDATDPEYRVEFWQDAGQVGVREERRVKLNELNQCLELRIDAVSSMKWPSVTALIVYDGKDCGGNRMVIYSAGLHKKVQPGGFTRDEGFQAGHIDDLKTVCKFDTCGYSSSAFSSGLRGRSTPPMLVGSVLSKWTVLTDKKCNCTDSWDDSIRTFKLVLTYEGAVKMEREKSVRRTPVTSRTADFVDDK